MEPFKIQYCKDYFLQWWSNRFKTTFSFRIWKISSVSPERSATPTRTIHAPVRASSSSSTVRVSTKPSTGKMTSSVKGESWRSGTIVATTHAPGLGRAPTPGLARPSPGLVQGPALGLRSARADHPRTRKRGAGNSRTTFDFGIRLTPCTCSLVSAKNGKVRLFKSC